MAIENDPDLLTDLDLLMTGGIGSFLKDEDVSKACRGWLKDEAGCKPPINHAVYFFVRSGLELAQKAAKSRLLALAMKNQPARKLIGFIANTCRQTQHRNELKSKLVENFNANRSPEQRELDASIPLDVLVALRQGQMLEGIAHEFESLATDIASLVKQAIRAAKNVDMDWHLLSHGDDSAIKAIRYDSGVFPLEGRESEFNILDEFLGDVSRQGPTAMFSWLCLVGAGGEGKTRLAFEYVRDRRPLSWTAGRLTGQAIENLISGDVWQPEMPTLFVIDYPAQYPALVGKLLTHLYLRSRKEHGDPKRLANPVRVLLLERTAKGPWMDSVLAASEREEHLKESVFRPQTFGDGWQLGPLPPVAIVSIMRERFLRHRRVFSMLQLASTIARSRWAKIGSPLPARSSQPPSLNLP
jgi:hypothetical protein